MYKSCLIQKSYIVKRCFILALMLCVAVGRPFGEETKIGVLGLVNSTMGLLLPPNGLATEPKPGICAPNCRPEWLGDGWCDTACASNECQGDGGDCLGWCAPDCKTSWIGDETCDIDCFRVECQWDGGDCDKKYKHGDLKIPQPAHEKFDYSKCPETCDRKLLHNAECDEACNLFDCNYDGGDCKHHCSPDCPTAWLGDGECDYACNVEKCGFDKGDCKQCAKDCEPGMLGNGVCDPQCNNEICRWDMGDCYGVCWSTERVDYFTEPFFFPHCRDEWTGDGFCDCYCMTNECGYDYGDCNGEDCQWAYDALTDLYQRLNLTLTEQDPHGAKAM